MAPKCETETVLSHFDVSGFVQVDQRDGSLSFRFTAMEVVEVSTLMNRSIWLRINDNQDSKVGHNQVDVRPEPLYRFDVSGFVGKSSLQLRRARVRVGKHRPDTCVVVQLSSNEENFSLVIKSFFEHWKDGRNVIHSSSGDSKTSQSSLIVSSLQNRSTPSSRATKHRRGYENVAKALQQNQSAKPNYASARGDNSISRSKKNSSPKRTKQSVLNWSSPSRKAMRSPSDRVDSPPRLLATREMSPHSTSEAKRHYATTSGARKTTGSPSASGVQNIFKKRTKYITFASAGGGGGTSKDSYSVSPKSPFRRFSPNRTKISPSEKDFFKASSTYDSYLEGEGEYTAAQTNFLGHLQQSSKSPSSATKRFNTGRRSYEGSTRQSRGRSGKGGFYNTGNTCYLNAVLQSILSLKSFVSDLQEMNEMRLKMDSKATTKEPNGTSSSFFRNLVELSKAKDSSNQKGVIDVKHLKDNVAVRYPMFVGNFQQDAHEFFSQCHNLLNEEVVEDMSPYVKDIVDLEAAIESSKEQNSVEEKEVINLLDDDDEEEEKPKRSKKKRKKAGRGGTDDGTESEETDEEAEEATDSRFLALMMSPVVKNFLCGVEYTLECTKCKESRVVSASHYDLSLDWMDPEEGEGSEPTASTRRTKTSPSSSVERPSHQTTAAKSIVLDDSTGTKQMAPMDLYALLPKCPVHNSATIRKKNTDPLIVCTTFGCKNLFQSWRMFLLKNNLDPKTEPELRKTSLSSTYRKANLSFHSVRRKTMSPYNIIQSNMNKPKHTVARFLKRFFSPRMIEYNCQKDECDGTHVQSTAHMVQYPQILVLHIKRFRMSDDMRRLVKITDPVEINTKLDLRNLDRTFPAEKVRTSSLSLLSANHGDQTPTSTSTPTSMATTPTPTLTSSSHTSSSYSSANGVKRRLAFDASESETNWTPRKRISPSRSSSWNQEDIAKKITSLESKIQSCERMIARHSRNGVIETVRQLQENRDAAQKEVDELLARISRDSETNSPISINDLACESDEDRRKNGSSTHHPKIYNNAQSETELELEQLLAEEERLKRKLDFAFSPSEKEDIGVELAIIHSKIPILLEKNQECAEPNPEITDSPTLISIADSVVSDPIESPSEEEEEQEEENGKTTTTDPHLVTPTKPRKDRISRKSGPGGDTVEPDLADDRGGEQRHGTEVEVEGGRGGENAEEAEEENQNSNGSPIVPLPKLKRSGPNICPEYTLHCFIQHLGSSASSGHYVSVVRNGGPQGSTPSTWDLFDDSRVRTISSTEALGERSKQSAYILFYVRNDIYEKWNG